MNERVGRQILLATFIGAVFTLTWSEVGKNKVVPRPARYVGAGMTWGILGLISPIISYRLAAMFGVGLYLALLYQYFNPNGNQFISQGLGEASHAPAESSPQQTKGE